MYVAEHGNDEKKVLIQLNQVCREEEIDEVEEFEIENSIENWVRPMKVELIAKKFALYNLELQKITLSQCIIRQNIQSLSL